MSMHLWSKIPRALQKCILTDVFIIRTVIIEQKFLKRHYKNEFKQKLILTEHLKSDFFMTKKCNFKIIFQY